MAIHLASPASGELQFPPQTRRKAHETQLLIGSKEKPSTFPFADEPPGSRPGECEPRACEAMLGKGIQDCIYGGPDQSEEERAKSSCTMDARMLLVAFLTFVTYMMYHAQRISFSAVASSLTEEAGFTATQLGVMSTGYMFAYAIGQFICGRFADTVRPKRALVWGMLCCALLPIIEGLMGASSCGGEGFCYSLWIFARIAEGLVQASGWTCTVAIMGNWFPQEGRGLIMGLWATNSNVGDIFGLHVSSAFLDSVAWYVILWVMAGAS